MASLINDHMTSDFPRKPVCTAVGYKKYKNISRNIAAPDRNPHVLNLKMTWLSTKCKLKLFSRKENIFRITNFLTYRKSQEWMSRFHCWKSYIGSSSTTYRLYLLTLGILLDSQKKMTEIISIFFLFELYCIYLL